MPHGEFCFHSTIRYWRANFNTQHGCMKIILLIGHLTAQIADQRDPHVQFLSRMLRQWQTEAC